jgi:hypothetical protein
MSKTQVQELKHLKKLVDDQQEKKHNHEMRLNVKQLALKESCERVSNPSAPKTPKNPVVAMGLDKKKELATHNALLNKQQNENAFCNRRRMTMLGLHLRMT